MSHRTTTLTRPAVKPSRQPTFQDSWPGRSRISIFIRCLRLLDLDRLEDWPAITENVFTTKAAQQNVQHKIRAVEWSLYRLFELYNGEETREKLRPFFPPSSPLQSLNLRAALYRYLTELKKNGVLGPHIQLRKTMLDECKGEKFEEVLASLAMIVLRRVTQEKALLDGMKNEHVDDDNLLPLLLAYRNSLTANLKQRKSLEEDIRHFVDRIDSSRHALANRKVEVLARSVVVDTDLNQRISNLVNENWIGNYAWAELITKGLPARAAFEGSTTEYEATRQEETKSLASQLVDTLDSRVKEHQNRLAEWRVIAKDLQKKQAETGPATSKAVQSGPTTAGMARFGQHQQLRFGQMPKAGSSAVLHGDYQILLDSMRGELHGVALARGNQDDSSEYPLSKNLPATLHDIQSPVSERIGGTALQESVSSEPLSPVVVHRSEATELASHTPLKTELQEKYDPISTPQQAIPNSKKVQIQTPLHETHAVAEEDSSADSSSISSVPEEESSMWTPLPKSSATTIKLTSPVKVSERIPSPDLQNTTNTDMPSSPSKEWMSLMDRTRLSMSNFGDHRFPLNDGGEPKPHRPRRNRDVLQSHDNDEESAQFRTTTLAERTRKSVSLLANFGPDTTSRDTGQHQHERRKSQHERRKSHHQRLSQMFPVNQFETPGRPSHRRQSEFGPSSESSTPRERLFEDEAEYASVFKSRPKLAMSPSFTPQGGHTMEENPAEEADDVGFDSILEQQVDMDRLQLASDDEYD